jgi:RNAse (barnase) inhibitor barstar
LSRIRAEAGKALTALRENALESIAFPLRIAWHHSEERESVLKRP